MPNVTCQCQVGMSTDNVNINVSAGQISRYHEISNYVWETKSEDMGKRTRKNLPKTFSVCFTFSNKKENQKRRAWKMKTRHENMGKEIYMEPKLYHAFYVLHFHTAFPKLGCIHICGKYSTAVWVIVLAAFLAYCFTQVCVFCERNTKSMAALLKI